MFSFFKPISARGFLPPVRLFSTNTLHLQVSSAGPTAVKDFDNVKYHEYGQYLMSLMPKYIQQFSVYKDELTLYTYPNGLLPALRILRDHSGSQFKQITDITAVDYPSRSNRFEIVYNLLSIRYSTRLRLKTYCNESAPIPSASRLFKSANWLEREVWDMYGVFFYGAP